MDKTTSKRGRKTHGSRIPDDPVTSRHKSIKWEVEKARVTLTGLENKKIYNTEEVEIICHACGEQVPLTTCKTGTEFKGDRESYVFYDRKPKIITQEIGKLVWDSGNFKMFCSIECKTAENL